MRTYKLFLYLCLCLFMATSNVLPATATQSKDDGPDPVLGENLTITLSKANEEDRATIWSRLTENEKDSVIAYNTVVKVAVDIPNDSLIEDNLSITASGCDVRGLTEKGYNYLGSVLWEYYSRVEWCYNGSTVTSKFATHTGKPGPFPSLWEYLGDAESPVEAGGVGQSYYRIWCNGHFRLAIAGYPIQTAYPWIDITVRGDGTTTATSGQ